MLTKEQAVDILHTLRVLPADKVAEVYDYVAYLRDRYGKIPVDISDAWSEQDLKDLYAASLAYADRAIGSGEV